MNGIVLLEVTGYSILEGEEIHKTHQGLVFRFVCEATDGHRKVVTSCKHGRLLASTFGDLGEWSSAVMLWLGHVAVSRLGDMMGVTVHLSPGKELCIFALPDQERHT